MVNRGDQTIRRSAYHICMLTITMQRIKIARETEFGGVCVCIAYIKIHMRKTALGCVDRVLNYLDGTVHIALRLRQPARQQCMQCTTQMEMCHNFLYTHVYAHSCNSDSSGGSGSNSTHVCSIRYCSFRCVHCFCFEGFYRIRRVQARATLLIPEMWNVRIVVWVRSATQFFQPFQNLKSDLNWG